MSRDSFTEVTNQSWFSRIGNAIKGVLIGLVLFVVAFPVLFWNEGRAVKTYKTLKEGGKAVVSVASDRVDPANEGKLIHVTGNAETQEALTDSLFGVSAKALKLRRVVEMYQWGQASEKKTKKKMGGGTETVTTYTYSKIWSDRPIDSAGFKEPAGHTNPGLLPCEATAQTAVRVTLGAFTLSPALLAQIGNFEVLPVPAETVLPASLQGKAKLYNAGFYFGADPASPQVGDTRVKFEIVKPAQVSVVAKQAGSTFASYTAKAGGTIELLQTGVYTADAMIQQAQESNRVLSWILRLAGFILMLVGLNMVLKPLSVIADVLPIMGSIIAAGTGVVSFLVAAILSLITVAVAWIVYRPLWGVILIILAVGLAVLVKGKLRSAKATV